MTDSWRAITCVGDLRKALADYPDDRRIGFQVKANDGQVWNMGADVGPVIGGQPPFPGISVNHPRLRALIEGDAPTMCAACLGHRHNDCANPDHACGCPECARAFGGIRANVLSAEEQHVKVQVVKDANDAMELVLERKPSPCIHQDPGQMTIAGLCGPCLHVEVMREVNLAR